MLLGTNPFSVIANDEGYYQPPHNFQKKSSLIMEIEMLSIRNNP